MGIQEVTTEDLRCAESVLGNWCTGENFPVLERQAGNHMSIDRLSNMLSTIKNTSLSGKSSLEVIYSKECEEVAKVLKERGFLQSVKIFKPEKSVVKRLHIELIKTEGFISPVEAVRVSKPGRRIYRKAEDLGKFRRGFGVMVVSTPKGIMSAEDARKKKLGGEVICQVY